MKTNYVHQENLIIYVGNFGAPGESAAGKRVFGNALLLSELGYKVVLIGKSNHCEYYDVPLIPVKNIKYYSFPQFKITNTSAYIKYIKKIMGIEGTPQIIIRYGSPSLAIFDKELLKAAKSRDIIVLADVVDWLSAGSANPLFSLVKTIDTYLEKGFYNCKCDGVIAISSYLGNYYKNRDCKAIVIPPLVSEYKRNTFRNPITKVVYAGVPFRLGKKIRKPSEAKDRLDLAVNGVARAIDGGCKVQFDIYGITLKQYIIAYPEHEDLVNRLSDSIIFHGNRDMLEVQEAVNHADFTILLREESRATMAGFPTKVVESMSCGTPVITTQTSDLRKYIINGVNGFFIDIKETEAIKNQLVSIFSSDKEQLLEMKSHCYERQFFFYKEYANDMKMFLDSFDNIPEV